MFDKLNETAERCAVQAWRVIGICDEEQLYMAYSKARNYLALVNPEGLERLLRSSELERGEMRPESDRAGGKAE